MVITRWDPFRDLATLQNRMNSLFQDYSRAGSGESDSLSTASFTPPVDIFEDEHKVVLTLEVPGIKQEDLNIEVENSTLSIRGERKFEAEQKQENYHRIERRYGSFYRAFTLPQTVNTESVSASYDAGVLRVELEKRAESRPRQIKVQLGGRTTNGSAMPVPQQPRQIENQPNA
jgi:HSP20 family protein